MLKGADTVYALSLAATVLISIFLVFESRVEVIAMEAVALEIV